MDRDGEEFLDEVLLSVRPYLAFPEELKVDMENLSEESEDLSEFEEKLESLISEKEDPSKKSDCKIFLNKLKSR